MYPNQSTCKTHKMSDITKVFVPPTRTPYRQHNGAIWGIWEKGGATRAHKISLLVTAAEGASGEGSKGILSIMIAIFLF
jgi:hypothetical protein